MKKTILFSFLILFASGVSALGTTPKSDGVVIITLDPVNATNNGGILPLAESYRWWNWSGSISIPDGPGGSWVGINCSAPSGIPSGAVVTKVKVHHEITHTYIGDLEVKIYNEETSHVWMVRDNEGGSADNINETKTEYSIFDGDNPTQKWYYRVRDTAQYDTGTLTVMQLYVYYETNESPTLNLTEPSSNITVSQGDIVTITWTDSDPDDNAYIALARDSDCSEGGHTWITVGLREDPDGSGDQYLWDTSGVPTGIYRIWGTIYDTVNPIVYDCAPGSVTITSEHCYTCPTYDYGTYTPNMSYSTHSASFDAGGCRWYRFDLSAGETYRFTTCEGGGSYSDDTVFTLYNSSCSQVASNDDTCSLGSEIEYTSTSSGYYYLRVENYSGGSESYTLAYKIVNQPPTFDLTGPSSDITVLQGDIVTITWTDSDPDDNAYIALAYDSDCSEPGHTWITVGLREDPDGSGDQYLWDTSGVPTGTYRIWGTIYDTVNPIVYDCAPGSVTIIINEPPTLNLIEPSSNITVSQGDTVTIAWTDSDPDDNAYIALAYDSDCSEPGHTWITVSLREDPDGSGDQYLWDTSGVPTGTYRIWGTIYDTVNPIVYDCAPGSVTVNPPPDIRIELLTLDFESSAAPPAVKQPVIASPDYFTFLQPNGVSFRARKFGDEFYHWMETDAGWTIAWNPAGQRYEYVDVDVNGKFEFTGLMVGVDDPLVAGIPKHVREAPEIVEKRQTRAMQSIIEEAVPDQAPSVPSTGTVTSLVILANFSDTSTTYSQADFNGLFNTIGYNQHGANGSVRDYYTEASYGNLLVDTTVSQWVTLPNTKAYYGANDGSGNDIRPREMIEDAIAALDAAGFDFSAFDADADGWIDSFSVIHQGPGEEAGGGADCIWSHAWAITPVQVDGIWISQYHTEPETYGGGLTTIGVICHEFGHALGLPDLYDTDYSSKGIGKWGVMAYGSWNNSGIRPGHFCSWSKIQLGWITPTVLGTSQTGINIARLSANAQAYKITSGMASDEYLLVENRQTSGNDFDDSLPGNGLLVYHIDDNQSNNSDETQYMVGLLQADGLWDLENNINRGDAGDPFPGSTNNRYLGPDSNPDTDSYYNGDTGIVIGNISNSGDPMSFNFGGQPFTIYNDGAGMLSVNSITPESAADWVSWWPQAPFDVAPGEYQVVTVSVDPTGLSPDTYSDRLLVYSNDPDENPYPGGVYVNLNVTCISTTIEQPPQDITICEGQDAVFDIDATGSEPLHYQWKKDSVDVGSDSSTLILPSVQLEDDDSEIWCEVTNACGSVVVSTSAFLTVLPWPTVTINPNPDQLNAAWILEGPNGYTYSSNGDETIADLEFGSYTITWSTIPSWNTPLPNPDTKNLSVGNSINFIGNYQLIADLNNDYSVDYEDLAKLANEWLWTGLSGGIPEDIMQDGIVNFADFALLAQNWLAGI